MLDCAKCDNIVFIFNIFKAAGFEIYLVGGCVRDMLMCRKPHDFDFATNATPAQMRQMAANNGLELIPTGEQYGTMTFKVGKELYEITTFRGEKDSKYSDGRRPDQVEFGVSLNDDLSRRDFTINAMAYNPDKGIVDLFGGQEDIKNKTIRCVGDADKRFKEDALRMLRALRFAGKLGFAIEPKTRQAILSNLKLIGNVSKERIGAELTQIFSYDCEERLVLGDLLYQIFNCPYDWYDHYSILSQFYLSTSSTLSRTTAKEKYFWTQLTESELNNFALGTDIVKGIMNLRKAANYIKENISYSQDDCVYLTKGILDILRTPQERLAMFEVFDLFTDTEFSFNSECLSYVNKALLFNEPIFISDLKITGNDIKEILNIEGKEIGNLLKRCQKLVWKYPSKNDKDLLLTFLKSSDVKSKELIL